MKLYALGMTFLLLAASASPTIAATRRGSKPAPAPAATAQTDLPLKRVVLYSNGVAYHERRGTISGRAEIALPFKQSQIDDVLKSMVVLDGARSRIESVSYESSIPANARLREVPFSVAPGVTNSSQAGGMFTVLGQLQGARVAVVASTGSTTGSILNVERKTLPGEPGKPPRTEETLGLVGQGGDLVSFDLSTVRSIKLLDEGAKRDVAEFAQATAATRRRDSKTIVIRSDGTATRDMLVSYTIAAPIWKTTYRILIGEDGKPFLQGWAIVDNTSEEDWNDVSLTLVAGSPVSFILPMQDPIYRDRPVVSLPGQAAIRPYEHEADQEQPSKPSRRSAPASTESVDAVAGEAGVNLPADGNGYLSLSQVQELSLATAAGQKVGDLFEYAIGTPVTIPRDRSALIPILQSKLDGERIAIYNEAALAGRPLSGIRLKNTSNLTLEVGPVTFIEKDTYAGEALMDRMVPGEERIISYGVDPYTRVATSYDSKSSDITTIKAAKGSLYAGRYLAGNKAYTITNSSDRESVIFVEHPRRDGWTLESDTPPPVETTEHFYRFRVVVAPKSTQTLNVRERQQTYETFALTTFTPEQLIIVTNSLDETSRAALQTIINLRAQLATLDRQINDFSQEERQIATDQTRLRENIKTLGPTPEGKTLVARFVSKLAEQETRLDQIVQERTAKTEERTRVAQQLASAISKLTFERTTM